MGAEADAAKAAKARAKEKEAQKEGKEASKEAHKESHKEAPKEKEAKEAKEAKERKAEPKRSEKAAPSEKPAPAKEAAKGKAEAPKKEERPRAGAERIGGYARTAPAPRVSEGLPEEALAQIAQAKFEAQEEKLRDVVRFSMVLLRDFAKLPPADRLKRASDAQKALLKYEMQYTRAWGYTEQRRRAEIQALEAEAERCRRLSADEEEKIVELRRILENEQQRRARYEAYEATAEEVNRKRSREEYKSAIEETKGSIQELKRRRSEHDAMIEERMQRAQLLAEAVAELKGDLLKERENLKDILKGAGVGEDAAAAAEAEASPSGPEASEPVEVIA